MGRLWCRAASVLMLLALLTMAATFRAGHAFPLEAAPAARGGATTSQWLEKVVPGRAREPGCWTRPWVCHEDVGGRFPPWGRINMKMCCNNRCVDVGSDANNCGACGVRCPFSWTCCNGVCVDPKTNPFHCGACNNRCALGAACSFGMCGYAAQRPHLPGHAPFRQPPCSQSSPPHAPVPPQKYYSSHP